MRELSSLTEPVPLAVEAWTLNHWTAREVPPLITFKYFYMSLPPLQAPF